MLRRGSLRECVGAERCDTLLSLANRIPAIPAPSAVLLDLLASVPSIDVGEAQLLAIAAEHGSMLLTGDKRALEAVTGISDFPIEALHGRVVVVEAILLALCRLHGDELIRTKLQPTMGMDTMIRVCFSEGNREPRTALRSYFESAIQSLRPLVLWDPTSGGAK
jgi:hypothetical protein